MPRSESVLDYSSSPFSPHDLDTPVVVIMDMNDGYHFIIRATAPVLELYDSNTQDQRGGIWVKKYDSLRAYFKEECNCEDEMGEFSYGIPENEEGEYKYVIVEVNEDEFFSYMNTLVQRDDSIILGGGLITITELSGSYLNPEELFDAF